MRLPLQELLSDFDAITGIGSRREQDITPREIRKPGETPEFKDWQEWLSRPSGPEPRASVVVETVLSAHQLFRGDEILESAFEQQPDKL